MLYDFLSVDKTGSELLYDQLYERIKSAIGEGLLKKGDKLPSMRALATDISVSRTTVDTAYEQLCAEGYLIKKPRSGYYVEADYIDVTHVNETVAPVTERRYNPPIKYDFSSSAVDPDCTDIKFWQRCVKEILDKPYVITSYGVPQGEGELRDVLCEYSRRVRGVITTPDRIVIGAGTQTLLSILLGLCTEYGFDAAMEKGFFPQGEQIFSDFRYDITPLSADKDGIILDDTVKSRMLFVNSSGSIRGSAPIPINKRVQIIRWAEQRDAVIIEDDFNGELRCTSKPVPALQGMCSERVVYIGSFSKLLLPSVRISYMVLPPVLADLYHKRMDNYNQTSSKTEQLALANYISCGRLDRQLRKLRNIYARKATVMYEEVKNAFPADAMVEVIETALSVRIKLRLNADMDYLKAAAKDNGIRLGKCREKNGLKYFYLGFSGIPEGAIHDAVCALKAVLIK